MTYSITPEQVSAITDVDQAFGSTKLLPPFDQIPAEFRQSQNIYHRIASSMFYGTDMPDGEVTIHEGFGQDNMVKCIRAHLCSFEPKHEHKMAGVAFMISRMATVEPGSQAERPIAMRG